ncbi:MAG TPA: phospholipid carrier-dependent glycosyltransferase [Candidatus Limnocylindrales bacterium]|nr:phospholipid carrier-dependent glycosyltransferase [Candidatus Limnocylindrales bacterium]
MSSPRSQSLRRESTEVPVAETRSYFDRWDLVAVLTLTLIAFVLRFFSPILPNIFLPNNTGPAITNCVANTPVDPKGDKGTICGLAYPFNRGYADANGNVSPPNGQVFDEIYFPVDAYDDVKGIESCHPTTDSCQFNYFDPEPPLAKEIIAAGMWSYGWYRAHFQGATGDYIDLGFNTFGWRIAACVFGTLCIPMMYLLARRLWPSRLFAIAAATLACFDGMFFIQSRIGMIDIFPIFFILTAYFLFLVHIQSRSFNTAMISLLALGGVLAIGIASKWIVLAAWACIVFWLVARVVLRSLGFEFGPTGWPFLSWRRDRGPSIAAAPWPTYLAVGVIALVIIPIGVYVLSWYPFFARGQFHALSDLTNYQLESFNYHKNLVATHPYGSPAWSWPLLSRPVLYYAEYVGLGNDAFTGQALIARMSNLGNPWIWWSSLPCIAALPYFIVRYRSFPAAVILLGFISQYLPWFPITRVLFMYHMFGGLIFMVLALAYVLVYLAERLPRPRGELVVAGYLAMAVIFFGYFYPVWTAVPLSWSAYVYGSGTPIWGPKLWLMNCHDLPPSQPQVFCWN